MYKLGVLHIFCVCVSMCTCTCSIQCMYMRVHDTVTCVHSTVYVCVHVLGKCDRVGKIMLLSLCIFGNYSVYGQVFLCGLSMCIIMRLPKGDRGTYL